MKWPEVVEDASRAELLATIAAHKQVLDCSLSGIERWAGPLRRDLRHRPATVDEGRRYANTFNRLAGCAETDQTPELNASTLKTIHDWGVGGKTYRKGGLRVGKHHHFPKPDQLALQVDEMFDKHLSGDLPAPVLAANLHLDVLLIHPFRDGNGRTSRLLAAYVLMRAGYQSRLLTAVEQHYRFSPRDYISLLDRFRYGKVERESVIDGLLKAMVKSSIYAFWFLQNRSALMENRARFWIPQLKRLSRDELAEVRAQLEICTG